MMKSLLVSICLLASVAGPSGDRFRRYGVIESYEIRPGVVITPVYVARNELCEINIERRHYSDGRVDMDAAMSKEQIKSMFDELVSKEERGGPEGTLPADAEVSEADLGMLTMRIAYKNVILTMYGKQDRPDRQEYIAAIISWNKEICHTK